MPWWRIFVATCLVVVAYSLFVLSVAIRDDTEALRQHIDRDLKVTDYVDARIEERIRFIVDCLKYDLGNGQKVSTNELVEKILRYLNLEPEYIPPVHVPARVVIEGPGGEIE